MPTPYAAGRHYEYKCVNELREAGYGAQRTAGSHGPFDVIAWNDAEVKLIQVKKVSGPPLINRAVEAAKAEWARYPEPPECCVALETWVYCDGQFHIHTL